MDQNTIDQSVSIKFLNENLFIYKYKYYTFNFLSHGVI